MFYSILIIFSILFSSIVAEEYRFTFNYYCNDYFLGDEIVAIEFPDKPEVHEFQGMQLYSAKDAEGTKFSLSALPIPDSKFDLQCSLDFFIQSLQKSQKKQFRSFDYNDGIYTVSWFENEQLTKLSILKSTYFIYFLETTGQDDSAKAASFVESFHITNGFSFD